MPEVEAEFARLNRDYDVHKSQYVALVDRLEKARLGQDAEATVPASTWKCSIHRPPVSARSLPIVRSWSSSVFVGSLGLGAALACVLSKLNPVFNHSRELEQITGLPVLGEVSLTVARKYNAGERRGYLGYSAVAGALVLAFACGRGDAAEGSL